MNRYSKNGLSGGSMIAYQPRQHRDYEPLSKTNIFIRGLGIETSDNDLFDLCSKFGTIVSTKSITDRLTNECKGYGFVNFENPDDAALAIRELSNGGYQARMSKENVGRSERSPFDRSTPPEFRRMGNPRFNGTNNRLSKTNLYLRGLAAGTTDSELHQLCVR